MAMGELSGTIFKMAVGQVSRRNLSFSEALTSIADNTRGDKLFDVRVEGDAKIQRIAAISFGFDGVGILALSHDTGLVSEFVSGDIDDFLDPLTKWASLPLRDQARVDHFGAATLLVAALRARGLPLAV